MTAWTGIVVITSVLVLGTSAVICAACLAAGLTNMFDAFRKNR